MPKQSTIESMARELRELAQRGAFNAVEVAAMAALTKVYRRGRVKGYADGWAAAKKSVRPVKPWPSYNEQGKIAP